MHALSPGNTDGVQTFGGGHGSPHVGYVPHVVGGQMQPVKSGMLMNVHVTPGGHALPQAGTAPRRGELPVGMQPQSKPPVTQVSPGGHTPSHSGDRVSPHGVVPATH
jgi:hypothetical protein